MMMANRETSRRGSGCDPARRQAQSVGFVVATCIALALGLAWGTFRGDVGGVAADEGEKINPNEASVASLARLPGVGPTRARAIVAYRDRHAEQSARGSAFAKADDVQRVKGIGPKVAADIRPWLTFDTLPETGTPPTEGR
jgi:competence ComEA-like helix-hairpin-helix protein